MRRIPLVLIWFALPVSVNPAAPGLKNDKDDGAKILGYWTVESVSQGGGEPRSSHNKTFRFGKDGDCGITGDAEGAKEIGARYKLDPSATPRRMAWGRE